MRRGNFPPMCDNARQGTRHRRSVEPALKLLWEHRRQMNAIKDAIKSGRTVVGTTVTPDIDVSILANAGYDFLLFDTRHSAWEIKQLRPSIETMRGKQAAPLVRVAANQAYQICFALDAGARGIIVPMVHTREEAEAAVGAS